MTKHELAKQVAADSGLSGEQAKSAVNAAFDAITGELAAGRAGPLLRLHLGSRSRMRGLLDRPPYRERVSLSLPHVGLGVGLAVDRGCDVRLTAGGDLEVQSE